jgi:flavin-dependent dehydrogenase
MPAPPSSAQYDVIVAGASFAGLAAARRLRGRVLLVDRSPIGEGLTSACAAPVGIVRMMGAEASIQQEHAALVIHAPGRAVVWPLPEPFCTFDYRQFCTAAARGAGVEFLHASVLGRDGHRVLTSQGAFDGRYLIDATGPRAALAGPGRPRHAAFGLESEIAFRVEPGLHFHFVPEVRDGHAWAFPCGGHTRFGVLSYRGRTQLLPALQRFMARFGARPGELHGGYLVTGWIPGVAGDVFVAGDAAGQCLPLTCEGIRTAVLAGSRCAALIQQVLDGTSTFAGAQQAYRAYIAEDRPRYRGLLSGNLLALALPQGWVGVSAALLARPRVLRWFFDHYFGIMRNEPDAAGPSGTPLDQHTV